MIPQKAMLKEKNIGIIGFNARPIACSIKALGGKTYVSDYWGDIDLVACSDEWTTVLAPKPGCRQRSSQERPIHLSLSDNFLSAFPDIEFDAILIGSGFDDHSSSLHRIQKNYGLSGNSPPMISSARNRKKIQSIINEDNLPARMPRSYKCRSVQHLLRSAIKVGFPCVVRPCTSGGGSGIRSFPDFETMAQYFDSRKSVELIVQEYIHGCDFSVSALGTGEEAKVLSIQSQLIGLPSAGRNCDFVYCGNYIPLVLPKSVITTITNVSESIIKKLRLVGSNGIDFILNRKSEIVLLEINPRIQGTLEVLERSGDISVTKMHMESIDGILPKKTPSWKPTVKMIVYARTEGIVPDLAKYPSSVDRSPQGVKVNRGDPICTLIQSSTDINSAYSEVCRTSSLIQHNL